MNDLGQAVSLSLKIAAVATLLTAVVGVPLAYVMRHRSSLLASVFEAVLLLPMVLPPTVVGYVMLMALGRHGWLSPLLRGYTIALKFEGAVLAAAVVALPMLYLPAKAAFAAVEREVEDSALTLGARGWARFWKVALPLSSRGVVCGVVLAFARAVGEFGATVMVFGMRPRRLTLPISIYLDWTTGELPHATAAALVLAVSSLLMIVCYNLVAARPLR